MALEWVCYSFLLTRWIRGGVIGVNLWEVDRSVLRQQRAASLHKGPAFLQPGEYLSPTRSTACHLQYPNLRRRENVEVFQSEYQLFKYELHSD